MFGEAHPGHPLHAVWPARHEMCQATLPEAQSLRVPEAMFFPSLLILVQLTRQTTMVVSLTFR